MRTRTGAAAMAVALGAALLAGCSSLHGEPGDGGGDSFRKGAGRTGAAIFTLGLSERWHSNETAMEAWLGCPVKVLLRQWPTPQQVMREGDGGTVYLWIEQEITPPPEDVARTAVVRPSRGPDGTGERPRGPNGRTPQYAREWGVFRQFHVDPSGTIVDYAWEGL